MSGRRVGGNSLSGWCSAAPGATPDHSGCKARACSCLCHTTPAPVAVVAPALCLHAGPRLDDGEGFARCRYCLTRFGPVGEGA